MSKASARKQAALPDSLAMEIQKLRRWSKDDQPLLRIDYREEAKAAPYQLDVARVRIHRNGCRLIPRSSRTSLYGMWQIGPEELKLACQQCRPVANKRSNTDDSYAMDLVYGMLSVIDQFGGVLRERGRQYRRIRGGRRPVRGGNGVRQSDDGAPKEDAMRTAVLMLDRLLRAVRNVDRSLHKGNGHQNGRGNGSSRS
jgi:hypothetical protein